ncbi:MAG: lipopolysaccharide biosynthesis protein [Patescibacteria group bacterium]
MEPTTNNEGNQGVYHRSVTSGKWFMLSVLGQKTINLVTFFVLARFLMPSDYGIIAIVLIVVGFLGQVTTPSGLMNALIQKKEDIEGYLDPFWTLDLLRSAAIALVLFGVGGWVAAFFNVDPAYALLLRLGGLMILVPVLANVRVAYLFKELNFRALFVRDIAAQATFSAVAILYAMFVSPTVWALFAGYMGMYVVGVGVSYVLYPSWPRVSFRFRRLLSLIGYGKWVYGQQLVEYALNYVDKLVLGRLLDTTQLGFYAKAKDFSLLAAGSITSLVDKIAFPAFSKIQDQIGKVREGFSKSLDMLSLSAVPYSLLILLEGGSLVSILLGERWLPLVVPLKIFSIGAMFHAIVSVVRPIFAALGRPDLNFKLNLLQAFVGIPLMVLGAWAYRTNGLAAAIVVMWILMLVFVAWKARPIFLLGKSAFVPILASTGLASIVVVAAAVAFRGPIHALHSIPADLAYLCGLGFLYLAVLRTVGIRLKAGPWMTFRSVMKELRIPIRGL